MSSPGEGAINSCLFIGVINNNAVHVTARPPGGGSTKGEGVEAHRKPVIKQAPNPAAGRLTDIYSWLGTSSGEGGPGCVRGRNPYSVT